MSPPPGASTQSLRSRRTRSGPGLARPGGRGAHQEADLLEVGADTPPLQGGTAPFGARRCRGVSASRSPPPALPRADPASPPEYDSTTAPETPRTSAPDDPATPLQGLPGDGYLSGSSGFSSFFLERIQWSPRLTYQVPSGRVLVLSWGGSRCIPLFSRPSRSVSRLNAFLSSLRMNDPRYSPAA